MGYAILAADEARNGGKNKEMIWKAFARRGLGYSAAQGDPNNCSDGEEAFDMPSMNKTESFSGKSDIKVAISPNPFSNELLVEPSNVSGSLRVEIYSIDGKQLTIPDLSMSRLKVVFVVVIFYCLFEMAGRGEDEDF